MSDEPLRMDAYYFGFNPTGVREIDLILSAVASAGKAYHHTEDWTEDDGNGSCESRIQDAANEAAKAMLAARPTPNTPTQGE